MAAAGGVVLLAAALAGCGPGDAERHAVKVRLTVQSARLEARLAEKEARLRRFEKRTGREPTKEPEPVPSHLGPGDFPTTPARPRWVPSAAPGEERSPRDPQPPLPGR